MKIVLLLCFSLLYSISGRCQSEFKIGWNTYKTGIILHEYTYNIAGKDSIQLIMTDSATVLWTSDSSVSVTINCPFREHVVYKTARFYNAKKQLVKTEEYKDESLMVTNEWKYDDKNRKCYHVEDNKQKGNVYKKTMEYATDKKTGETICSECAYFNGRIEFYTKCYYNKANEKYKEVRLNDNNKDVVHIESYTYGENGKVKERSVFFPEWKVTRKFQEKEGNQLPKCFKSFPLASGDKVTLATKEVFLRKFIPKIQTAPDRDCDDYEFKFSKLNCEVALAPTKVNNGRKVTFRFRERVSFNP
jgi:hypothetical protein